MYGGLCHERHFHSCIQLKEQLTLGRVEHAWLTGAKESLVHRGRMEMTATFLQQTNHSHMMWLDGDIEFAPEDVGKIWALAETAEVVVGVYAMKKDGEEWYSAWKDGKLVDIDRLSGPTEVDYAGTGFMMISRKAIVALHQYLNAREARGLKLLSQLNSSTDEDKSLIKQMANSLKPDYEGQHGRVPALYMTPIHDDSLESEDYHFCRVAREAGFKVMMDPSVRLIHWGQKGYGKASVSGVHFSDCAQHNAPALPVGPCDCGADA